MSSTYDEISQSKNDETDWRIFMWIICLAFAIFYARVQYAGSRLQRRTHRHTHERHAFTHLDQNIPKQTDASTQKTRDTLGKHEREPTFKMFTTVILRKFNFGFKNVGS